MTRVQFLSDLYLRLGALQKDQAEEWLVYYDEMLADRMEEGMGEEEAVASLEDLDTIAVRILQEAGLPPEAMTRPAAPPAYPGPPAGGGGGKQAYRPPRRRGRLTAVLWVLAGVAVLAAGARWVFGVFAPPSYTATASTAVEWYESTPPDVPVLEQGAEYGMADGEYTYTFTPGAAEVTNVTDPVSGSVYVVAQWEDGNSFLWRMESVDGEPMSGLRINWPSGAVTVRTTDSGGSPVFQTAGAGVDWSIRNGTLYITQAGAEELEVWVPTWQSVGLEVETGDADVLLTGDTYGEIAVETGSGDVNLEGLEATESVKIATESGSVRGAAAYLWSAGVRTASGDVDLRVESAYDLSLSSGSGDVSLELRDPGADTLDVLTDSGDVFLVLPEEAAFQLRWRTGSGELDGGVFPLTQQNNGRYQYYGGSGSAIRIDVQTASGDLNLASFS